MKGEKGMEFVQWVTWLAGAVAVVGVLQWIKGLAPKAPSWAWSVAMVALSIAAAFAAGGPRPWFDALGIAAISQLGYELIIQVVRKKIAGVTAGSNEG
jgi:hypothetical protein